MERRKYVSEKSELISKLKRAKKSRDAYTRALLNVLISAQIKGLRFKRKLTQKGLADLADMKQSRISTMERPGATKFNIETLIRLASAFRVGLKVEFVSFSEMLKWENGFNQAEFDPLTIDLDAEFEGAETVSAPAHASEDRAGMQGLGRLINPPRRTSAQNQRAGSTDSEAETHHIGIMSTFVAHDSGPLPSMEVRS